MNRSRMGICGVSWVLMAALGACGDEAARTGEGDSVGSEGDYCGQVKELMDTFEVFRDTDVTLNDVSGAVALVDGIKEAASDDIESEWAELHDVLGHFEHGLENLGVAPDEPMGTALKQAVQEDKAKAKKFMETVSGMQEIESDMDAIEKQVKSECDIDLSDTEVESESGGN